MGEPKYTGFGSKIVVDQLKPKSKRNVGEKQNAHDKANKPPWEIDMRFFTLKLNPAGDRSSQLEEALGACLGRGFTVEPRTSPTNSASDESFHSCASAASRVQGGRPTPGPPRRDRDLEPEPFRMTMVNAVIINNSVGQYAHARGDEGQRKCSRPPPGPESSERDAKNTAENVAGDGARRRKSTSRTSSAKNQSEAKEVTESTRKDAGSRRESSTQQSAPKCHIAAGDVGESVSVEGNCQQKSNRQSGLRSHMDPEDVRANVCADGSRQRKAASQSGQRSHGVPENVAESDCVYGSHQQKFACQAGLKCHRDVQDAAENVCSDSSRQMKSNFQSFLKSQRGPGEESVHLDGSRQRKSVCQSSLNGHRVTDHVNESVCLDPTSQWSPHSFPSSPECQRESTSTAPCSKRQDRTAAVTENSYGSTLRGYKTSRRSPVRNRLTTRFAAKSPFQRITPGVSKYSTPQSMPGRVVHRVDSTTSVNSEESGTGSGKREYYEDRSDNQSQCNLEIVPREKRDVKLSGKGKSMQVSDQKNPRLDVSSSETTQYFETYYLKESFLEVIPKMDRGISAFTSCSNLDLQNFDDCFDLAQVDLARPIGQFDASNDLNLATRGCSDLEKMQQAKTRQGLQQEDKRLLFKNLKAIKGTKMKPKNAVNIVIHPWVRDIMPEEPGLCTSPRTSNLRAIQEETKNGLKLALYGSAIQEEQEKSLELAVPMNASSELPTQDRPLTLDGNAGVVYMKENLVSPRKRRKRSAGRPVTPLPVIKEESSESLESISSEASCDSNSPAEYCLVDNLGRPIHLYDGDGQPLTDSFGRLLRDADGRTLVACDAQGVPVVDPASGVFDHLGRHALDAEFAPWGAPPAPPPRRLLVPSGLPLLLFNARGRPLTAVDGGLLTDSAGVPLLMLDYSGGSKG